MSKLQPDVKPRIPFVKKHVPFDLPPTLSDFMALCAKNATNSLLVRSFRSWLNVASDAKTRERCYEYIRDYRDMSLTLAIEILFSLFPRPQTGAALQIDLSVHYSDLLTVLFAKTDYMVNDNLYGTLRCAERGSDHIAYMCALFDDLPRLMLLMDERAREFLEYPVQRMYGNRHFPGRFVANMTEVARKISSRSQPCFNELGERMESPI